MAIPAVLFLLSEVVVCLRGCQQCAWQSLQLPALFAVEPRNSSVLVVLPWDRPVRSTGRICSVTSG